MSAKILEAQVGKILKARGMTLATAESCTGGLLSHRITNIAGSSEYFKGGIVAYSNSVKMALLGVQETTLQRFGAVSKETVLEMARGVRFALQADIGISISGIAGPGGGTAEKPVGLTWIGLDSASHGLSKEYVWRGNRLKIKEQTAQAALQLLIEYLEMGTLT